MRMVLYMDVDDIQNDHFDLLDLFKPCHLVLTRLFG